MNIKLRKQFARFDLLYRAIRYVMYNSGSLFCMFCMDNRKRRLFFKEIKHSHDGERCFIIGNGPSLCVEDLERISKFDSFGTNEIHRIFDKTSWRPKYYLIFDRYSKTSPDQVRDMDVEYVFLGDYYWRHNSVKRKDAVCIHQHQDFKDSAYRFSEDISKCVYNSPTVSYGAIQIAAYMGYSEIYLLGFDHNYCYEFDREKNVVRTSKDNSHFFRDESPDEIIANIEGMTKAYESCKEYCDKKGISVRNASRGGNLGVFERVNLDELFE